MRYNSLSLSVEVPEKLITTKELAQVLCIDKRTINETVQRLVSGNVLSHLETKSVKGGKTWVFTEKQATIIKQEIQKHHNLATRQIDTVTTEFEENQTIANAMAILQRRSIELQQQIENKNKQIEELTPDAESWRKFVDSEGSFTASNVAKLLHISRDNDLIPFLLLKKYIMRERHDNPKHAGNLVGTALGIERGYIKNYLYTNNKISRVQFKITPEGMQKIEKAFCHNELTPSEQRRVNALCQEAERKMKPTSIGRAE